MSATPCPGCRGDGRIRCGICLGYQRVHGNRVCGSCSGLGTVNCPRCRGNASPDRLRWDYGRSGRPARRARSDPPAAFTVEGVKALIGVLHLLIILGLCWLCAGRPLPWR
jgi:hypothetical protein